VSQKNLDKLFKRIPTCFTCSGPPTKKKVPATLIIGKKKYDVKIALRGICGDHWMHQKKSWKVIFPKNNLYHGVRRIDLIPPISRGFLTAELSQYRARKLGLLVPESRFITLRINGRYYGVYWEVEDKDKKFLEKGGRPSDVNLYGNDGIQRRLYSDISSWKKDSRNPNEKVNNYGEIDLLLNLLNNASDKEFYKKIPFILDMNNFYRWQVHETLLGGYHQIFWNNASLYFDSTSGKFKFTPEDVSVEPTRFNLFSLLKPVTKSLVGDKDYNPLVTRILRNPKFVHERNKVLWSYVGNENNIKDDKKFYDSLYQKVRWPTYKETRNTYSNLYYDVYQRLVFRKIEGYFNALRDLLKDEGSPFVKVEYEQPRSRREEVPISFEITVDNFSGIKLDEITLEMKKASIGSRNWCLFIDTDKDGIFSASDKEISCTDENRSKNEIDFKNIELNLLANREIDDSSGSELFALNFNQIKVVPTTYRFFLTSAGTLSIGNPIETFQNFKFGVVNAITGEKIKLKKIYVDKRTFATLNKAFWDLSTFLQHNPEFRRLSNQEIYLPYGTYFFNDDLIVPVGLHLKIAPGTTLKFARGKSIISYSPIVAEGKANAPIVFTSKKHGEKWGVVGILNTEDQESRFKYVVFENGGEAYINGVFFSGQLSAYHSKVEISDSTFRFANGDDAVNIKSSNSIISTSFFYDNKFDAVDLDFNSSKVINSRFRNNGNDAIDLSDGKPYIFNNIIEGSGDKGISVGEKSQAVIINNLIRKNNIGIAIKDLSFPVVVNNTVIDNQIGISAYQKKEIFGGGKGKIVNSIIWNNKQQIVLDSVSYIEVSYSIVQGGYKGVSIWDKEPRLGKDFYLQDYSLEINLDEIRKNCQSCAKSKNLTVGIFRQ
jgi:parallel beta-helix repeat protein